MRLDLYLSLNQLSQVDFAAAVGVSPGMVWQWLAHLSDPKQRHARRISPEKAKTIEAVTLANQGKPLKSGGTYRGAVMRWDSRPDLWDSPMEQQRTAAVADDVHAPA